MTSPLLARMSKVREEMMELEPFDWNVVIAAYWNRAIFTPNGIAKRLFKIPEGAGMEVLVPVNLLESPVVKYDDIIVRVEDRRLIVGATKGSYEVLSKAMEMGRNALLTLPETPASAAGFNVRFKITSGRSKIEHLVAATDLDGCLSDTGYEIVGRFLNRRIRCRGTPFEKGIVTFSLDLQDDAAKIEMNFHRDSNDVKELVDWLSISSSDARKTVEELLSSCGCTDLVEVKNVNNA